MIKLKYPKTIEIKLTWDLNDKDTQITEIVFIRPEKIKDLVDKIPFFKDAVKKTL